MTVFGGEGVIVGPITSCVVCKEATRFYEVNFQVPAHLGVCVDSLWADYWKALREADERAPGAADADGGDWP